MGKVMVTGASGFVGSRLVRALVERGEVVRVLVRAGSSRRFLDGLPADQVEVCLGDILIEHEVYRALIGCDRLYHVAAVYKMFARNPSDILLPAVQGTRITLEAARKRGIHKVVVTSSVAALGVNDRPEPMDESHVFNLRDTETYILAKWQAEQEAMRFAQAGLPVVVVNPSGI
ncbi:MAG: NAD-dependent epimerase/dehydratase family protein, partial [Polyangiaceae bacterium]|nr:NAD-dependent epimerase/dehydratase family protein [Polyangiaceae bacterium]